MDDDGTGDDDRADAGACDPGFAAFRRRHKRPATAARER